MEHDPVTSSRSGFTVEQSRPDQSYDLSDGLAPKRTQAASGTPSALRCLMLIFGIKVALKAVGFERTLRLLRHATTHATDRANHHDTDVYTAAQRVAAAAALYPGRALCLEQSIALYLILRRSGHRVRLRFGVQPSPFAAHAWVEYRGEAINERDETTRHLAVLPDLL